MSNKIMQKEILGDLNTFTMQQELNVIYTDFVTLRQVYSAGIKEIRTKLEILDDEFEARFDHSPIHHMEYRLKSPKSIFGKLKKRGLEVTIDDMYKNITDIAGVRVICNYIDDIYQLADLLTKQDDVTVSERKDYIAFPKKNGYRSLHLVVQVPIFLAEKKQLIPVEIQIRTIAMDFWASLEHRMKYKAEKDIPANLKDELLDCANTITKLDTKMQTIHNQLRYQQGQSR